MFGLIMVNGLMLLDVYGDICTCRNEVLCICSYCSQVYLPVMIWFRSGKALSSCAKPDHVALSWK